LKISIKVKVTERIVLIEIHLRSQNYGTPLVSGITQCYLPPDRGDPPPRLHPNRAGWYSIYRPRKDERLSWHSWLVTYREMVYPYTDGHPFRY